MTLLNPDIKSFIHVQVPVFCCGQCEALRVCRLRKSQLVSAQECAAVSIPRPCAQLIINFVRGGLVQPGAEICGTHADCASGQVV